MTLRDWVLDTHSRFVRDPPKRAAKGAGLALWYGALRRAAPALGVEPEPDLIWDRDDWDIVCVLDACRSDLYYDLAWSEGAPDWLPESGETITAAGSMSAEWHNHTFTDDYAEEMERTALITGNPFAAKDLPEWPNLPLDPDDFGVLDFAVESEWTDHYGEGISTIPPEPLTDRAIDCWRRREELGIDRVVVHYMQPHAPFRSRPEWFGATRNLNEFGKAVPGGRTKSIWKKLRDGEVGRAEVWDAYQDNLLWVLESVDVMRRNADATIALTADHGNALGEWHHWGHPAGSPISAVRDVPWVTVEGVDTHNHTPEMHVEAEENLDDSELESQLEALGYV